MARKRKDKQEKFFYRGFDLTLAIIARRTLVEETHCIADCMSWVYNPTRKLLEELARQKPSMLHCLHGPLDFFEGTDQSSCDVYLATEEKKVLYICSVFNPAMARAFWEAHQTILERIPEKLAVWAERGYMAITLFSKGCKVPVDSNTLDSLALNFAIRRYMQTYVPPLAQTPVVWMALRKQKELRKAIFQKAKETAKCQTEEEKIRITAGDM